jgi:hypothetical protein
MILFQTLLRCEELSYDRICEDGQLVVQTYLGRLAALQDVQSRGLSNCGLVLKLTISRCPRRLRYACTIGAQHVDPPARALEIETYLYRLM